MLNTFTWWQPGTSAPQDLDDQQPDDGYRSSREQHPHLYANGRSGNPPAISSWLLATPATPTCRWCRGNGADPEPRVMNATPAALLPRTPLIRRPQHRTAPAPRQPSGLHRGHETDPAAPRSHRHVCARAALSPAQPPAHRIRQPVPSGLQSPVGHRWSLPIFDTAPLPAAILEGSSWHLESKPAHWHLHA